MKDNTKRNKEIVELFNGGRIQNDIASMFGISRERVRQILCAKLGADKVSELVKKKGKLRRDTISKEKEVIFVCQNCNIKFPSKYIKRRFCSIDCFKEYKKKNALSEEQKAEKRRVSMREYYYKKLKLK